MKKLLLSLVLLFGLITFSGCGSNEETPLTDVQLVEQAKESLDLGIDLNNVKDNIVFPGDIGTVEVSWASNNTNVIANSGVVTRQSSNTTVVLTATLSLNEAEANKAFTLTVIGTTTGDTTTPPTGGDTTTPPTEDTTPEETVYTLAEVKNLSDNTEVKVNDVIVMSLTTDGYYVTDNKDVMFVYTGSGASSVSLNSKGNLEGIKSTYNSMIQIKPTNFDNNGTGIVTLEATPISIADIYSSNSLNGYYAVSGTLNSDLELVDGEKTVKLYKNSSSIAVLEAFIDEDITVNVFTYCLFDSVWNFTFNGTESDVVMVALTDAQKVAKTEEQLKLSSKVYEDIELLTSNEKYGTSISWVSSDNDALSDTGVVNRTSTDVEVTLTATITLNEVTTIKQFVITVASNEAGNLEELTIDFKTGLDMGTEYKDSTFTFFKDSIFSANVTNVWGGVNYGVDGGIKIGSGSKIGALVINNDSNANIVQIKITAKVYGSDGASLVVNGTTQSLAATFVEYTFDINDSTNITIETSIKRMYVEQITIIYS